MDHPAEQLNDIQPQVRMNLGVEQEKHVPNDAAECRIDGSTSESTVDDGDRSAAEQELVGSVQRTDDVASNPKGKRRRAGSTTRC